MARKSNSMLWVLLLGGGALAYYLYKNSAAGQAAAAAAALAPPASGGTTSSSSATASAPSSSDLWDSLSPVTPLAYGYINFPSGSQAQASSFSDGLTRMDASNNYYVQWAGQTYMLGQQDASGNYPATAIGT